MKKTWVALALALGALGGSTGHAQDADDPCQGSLSEEEFSALPRAEQVRRMTCMMELAADSVQDQLPAKLDEFTTMTSVTANGTIITYLSLIDLGLEDVPDDGPATLMRGTRENVCGDENMSAVIRMGGGYRYVWKLADGQTLAETTIDAC